MRKQQHDIIAELGSQPTIDPAYEIARRTDFLASYLANTGMKGYVLGISGGQDSLLAGILAERAVAQRRETGDDVAFHAVLLPYGEQTDRDDALLALRTIQPDVTHDINIKPATDAFVESFNSLGNRPLTDFNKGNVKARMRMIAQYALAGQYSLLVLGTDHAAEAVTGFFTKFGDGGADVLPLAGLTKRQGREMLAHLGVPEIFIRKQPTADLLDARPGQPDETELALSYETIDDYLEGRSVDERAAEQIEQRFAATAHKRDLPVAAPSL